MKIPLDQSVEAANADKLEELFCNLPAYKIKERGKCGHHYRGRLVDGQTRKVTCRGCDEELDAFECLLDLARHHQRVQGTLDEIKRKTEAAHERLQVLLREERNAKARLRRNNDGDSKKAADAGRAP